jgi:hypothetical protein
MLFERELCFGEVVSTSLSTLTLALWPQKKTKFGSIVFIQNDPYPYLLVGIVIELWQEAREASRQIIPLQLTPLELQVTYPHLASLLTNQAKITIVGKYDIKNDRYSFLQPEVCPMLHAWAKDAILLESNTPLPLLKLLEKISNESWDQALKENLFQIIALQLFKCQKDDKLNIVDKLYHLAEKVFCGDFFKVAVFFTELETSL